MRPGFASGLSCTLALLVAVACGSSNDGGGPSSGGTSGSAGNDAAAGTGASAGEAGSDASSAGAAGGAGADAAAGSAGSDAAAGSAGSGGMGGGAGAAGNAGAGGSAGGGGTPATITPGAGDRILLVGTVLTPDTSYDGEVLVSGNTIVCADQGTACESNAAASGATRIDTHGVILPGLIDTHNHILFDVFDEDDWTPNVPTSCAVDSDCRVGTTNCGTPTYPRCGCVDNTCRYLDHDQWPKEPQYGLMLDYKQCLEDASQGKPSWCPQTYDGAGNLRCELDKWGELKGLVAGTTSIVGLPGAGATACFHSLARSVDLENGPDGQEGIQTNVGFPPSTTTANNVCKNFTSGATKAYLIHVGEGTDAAAKAELGTLGSMTTPVDCLYAPQTTITHGVAFSAADFALMASHGMKLTWSPASNVALYGTTADIPAALAAGVTIALGPDWSMGGSQNMLDELRFANAWDDSHFGDVLTPKDLVVMATENGAKVLASDALIGSIAVGKLADLFVVGGDRTKPYDAVLAARPIDVRLVMVGGTVLYGDQQLEPAAPAAPGCEHIDVCGASKFLCVATTDTSNKLGQTYADLQSILDGAMTDLDSITPLPAGSCSQTCGSGEACYPNTVHAQLADTACGGPCPAGQACFQLTASTVGCDDINACAPVKNHTFAPIAPLVGCN